MLRLFRTPRGIFKLGARVHGTHGTQGPEPQVIRVQRVKIRRKWFKPMNFIIAAGVYYGCYQIYKISVFGTLGRWMDQQVTQMSKREREELEEEIEEPLFIPFPFTTRMVEPLPYRSTDPEWQAFVKVSKNRKLVRTIQDQLAEVARRAVESHPMLAHKCGKDAKVGKHWLDIQYPYKPPPTFARKGLSIDDDGISVEEQPVDSLLVVRVQRALWPSALTLSLWSFSGALMKQNALTVAKFLGFESEPPPNPNLQQAMEKIHQQLKKPPVKSDSQVPSSLSSSKTQAADGSSTDSTSGVDKRAASAPGSSSASGAAVGSSIPPFPNAESNKPRSAKDIYAIKLTQEHTSGPWQTFKQKLAQTWRPASGFPPRGSFNVSGLVEVVTPRAVVTVDVNAWWDPKTEKFDARTLSLRLKALRMKTQTALR